MTCMLNGTDCRLAVVIHPSQLHAVAALVSVKQHIGRLQARGDGIADAAQIDRMDPARLTIKRHMGVPDQDQVRLAARQPSLQLSITVTGLQTRPIISSWGRMHAKHACAIGQGQAHFQRQAREPVQPARRGSDNLGSRRSFGWPR